MDKSFCWFNGGASSQTSLSRQLNVHTQRDARKGRATEPVGEIYRYDALAAGTRFQAIILTTEAEAATLEGLLDKKMLWIGRARRAGYGKAEVVKVETTDYWRESEAGDSPRSLNAGDHLRIIFTSNVLLRDENGQPTLNPRVTLEEALGLPPKALTLLPRLTWAKSGAVGGFNRKWGLPLPQTVALTAGSVFIYETTAEISHESLATLEFQGIGERRNEGFGQLLVNWLQDESEDFEGEEINLSPGTPKLEKLSSAEAQMAQVIAHRILCLRLDDQLLRRINYTKVVEPPRKNQLARLRVILRAVQAGRDPGQADLDRLTKFLDDIEKRDTSRKQFDRARIDENGKRSVDDEGNPRSLTGWIHYHLNDALKIWTREPVLLGEGDISVSEKVDETLAREYALRLIDQVLDRAAKEQQ